MLDLPCHAKRETSHTSPSCDLSHLKLQQLAKPVICPGLQEALTLPVAPGSPDVFTAGKGAHLKKKKNPIVCNVMQFSLEIN